MEMGAMWIKNNKGAQNCIEAQVAMERVRK